MRIVTLVPIEPSPNSASIDRLADSLGAAVHAAVRVRSPWFDTETAYEPSRGQYSSTELLAHLTRAPKEVEPDGGKLLGVTCVDLFIPVLTFVFGEAQLDGRAAIVSTHRLRSELYGLAPDAARLHDRLAKEALHELGHAYGLLHCYDPDCVMRASTYVEEVDLKSSEFCDACRAILESASR